MSAKLPGALRRAHLGTWRALATLPVMIASLLLLVFLLGGVGRWEAPILLSWLAAGVLTLSAPGERVAARVVCRFRRLSTVEHAHIDPTLIAVLKACGLARHDVDLYVWSGRGVNAYAAGRRSVAVTRQVVDRHRTGRLGDDVLAGLLSHEVGHLVTRGVRWSLIIAWFAMPWRLVYRVGGRIAAPLASRQPRTLLVVVVLAGFTIAISQAVQHGEWGSAVVLSALVLCPVISPVSDAAISRASEHAADRYAARVGYGHALTLALRAQGSEADQTTFALLGRYPAIDRRLRRLQAATDQPSRTGELRAV